MEDPLVCIGSGYGEANHIAERVRFLSVVMASLLTHVRPDYGGGETSRCADIELAYRPGLWWYERFLAGYGLGSDYRCHVRFAWVFSRRCWGESNQGPNENWD